MCVSYALYMYFTASSVRPQPYETDLSYLEDQFQLIETLLKARKSETNEDSYTLRYDQRKPEAVARELRAKARGLQARVQSRMEATRKNGGKWNTCIVQTQPCVCVHMHDEFCLWFCMYVCICSRNAYM